MSGFGCVSCLHARRFVFLFARRFVFLFARRVLFACPQDAFCLLVRKTLFLRLYWNVTFENAGASIGQKSLSRSLYCPTMPIMAALSVVYPNFGMYIVQR